MENTADFAHMFKTVVHLFELMYSAGLQLFTFFSSPLSDTIGNEGELADLLQAVLPYTPFELMFGFGLMTILVTLFVKIFVPI